MKALKSKDKSESADSKPDPEKPHSTPITDTVSQEEPGGRPREIGGRKGPDPTRYGDWEKNGRCIDF